MSDPMWCEVRQHYCRCHDYGKRCDDFDNEDYELANPSDPNAAVVPEKPK
jgi:hypothetical protein